MHARIALWINSICCSLPYSQAAVSNIVVLEFRLDEIKTTNVGPGVFLQKVNLRFDKRLSIPIVCNVDVDVPLLVVGQIVN